MEVALEEMRSNGDHLALPLWHLQMEVTVFHKVMTSKPILEDLVLLWNVSTPANRLPDRKDFLANFSLSLVLMIVQVVTILLLEEETVFGNMDPVNLSNLAIT
jgi:hypothetical protein